MKGWFNKLMRTYLNTKYRKLQEVQTRPIEAQQAILRYLLANGCGTEYGKLHGFDLIEDAASYAAQVPITDYETLKGHINKMMHGARDVLWPGKVNWYAKSSGTTSERSKFIPMPDDNLKGCHHKSSWDALALLYAMLPDANVFHKRSLIIGGTLSFLESHPDTTYGDVSAIMLQHMPAVGRPFFTPDIQTALMEDWEEKIEMMVRICMPQDIGFFGGVPTWLLVLFKRILEISGKDNLLEVWPNLQTYTHGGVGFAPYRNTFQQLIPSETFVYQEVYNASEGFFAAQDTIHGDDMLLLVDNGMYYEFIPMSEWDSESPSTLRLQEVEIGKPYALVISTNAGLWRYTPGDTISFTSLSPHRIKIEGRTQQYINAFGEEVMIANAEQALATVCRTHNALVADYTVAPVYLDGARKGKHQWLIEFDREPEDLAAFSNDLDKKLQSLNSDYEAKRSHNLALEQLEVRSAPQGAFQHWLALKNKLGGQNKVPRLANDRRYMDEIIRTIQQNYE